MKANHISVIALLLVAMLTPCLHAAGPLDESFIALAKYKDGDSRVAIIAIEKAVYLASSDAKSKAAMAGRLIALIEDKSATAAAKNLTCQLLPLVGDARAVKPLVALMGNPKTVGPARGALQRLAVPEAAKALRDALGKAAGSAKIGLINSIGARRDAEATGALKALTTDKNVDIAAAAMAALGEIGSSDAVTALTDKKLKPSPALLDALLQCAETDAKSAPTIYRRLISVGKNDNWKWAGLTGLAGCSPADALVPLLAVLDAPDVKQHSRALSLIATLPGAKATEAMTARLAKSSGRLRILLLDTLARRGDGSAADVVAGFLGDKDAAVRSAAIEATGHLGGARHIAALVAIAADSKDPSAIRAWVNIVRLPGKDVDAALIAGVSKGKPAVRAELIGAAAQRGIKAAIPAMLTSATDSEAVVRKAACKGLTDLAGRNELPKLVVLLAKASDSADCAGLSQAILATGRRIEDNPAVSKVILVGLRSSDGESAAALLKTIAYFGGADALPAVVERVDSKNATVSEAALRSLTNWPDATVCSSLLKIISNTKNTKHRILAMRGYLRLAPLSKDPAGALEQIRKLVKTPADKRMMLSAMGGAASTESLDMALSMLGDADVKLEAAHAALAIAQQLASKSPADALAAVAKVRATNPPKAVLTKASVVETLAKRRPGRSAPARRTYDKKVVDARKKKLATAGPKGCKMVLYLDCGVETQAGASSGPKISQLTGASWVWPGSGSTPAGTVAYDGNGVSFSLTGLDAKKQYALAFSWWDCDNNGRIASLWAAPKGGKDTQLLKATKLPTNKHADLTVGIPKAISAKGQIKLTFKREGQSNTVVGEIWLWEAGAGATIKTPAITKIPTKAPAAAPTKLSTVMPVPKDTSKTNVLIVTGVDYPGHKWKQTAPVIAAFLAKDKRMEVQIVADPHQLSSATLHKYEVIVVHFMNWKVPAPNKAARENFSKFIESGGGMVMVHFACGAWQDWPGFVKIAGRVYNPKFRGHDRRGPFTVEIVGKDHEITRGMKDFETYDELYTCLDGKTPIDILAHSKSKVDKKYHPMGFVLKFGKGRVFHSPLGHDVRAFEAPGVQELFRRGAAWAGKLKPAAGK
ncbi:MAG: ThuA domain-containing protein [Phycisphaerae bacterium]|jgi:type 1 glutamine amidotransferase|nr:ThuA domain-containing protein [Phycisphaerae bacterium]